MINEDTGISYSFNYDLPHEGENEAHTYRQILRTRNEEMGRDKVLLQFEALDPVNPKLHT